MSAAGRAATPGASHVSLRARPRAVRSPTLPDLHPRPGLARAIAGALAAGVARGAAVLYGLLALLAVVAELRGASAGLSLWWIDLGVLPAPVRIVALAAGGAILLAWALVRETGRRLRATAAVVALLVAAVAVRDTIVILTASASGAARLGVTIPLSAVTAVGFGLLALVTWRSSRRRGTLLGRGGIGLGIAVVAWAVVFPLAQMLWFGTTDYRRPADAAVVFGARVYASGRPSPLLWDRLRTGIELYRQGLVARLVMSGGDGADGFNEARVMADVAAANGVPHDAILLDESGVTTEATVRNSLAVLAAAGAPDPPTVIAVSQAYHLPRVQLAYSEAGIDVLTVPAPEAQPIVELPLFIAREVPAFWSYLLRICLF
jgi:vancomycin permeability regulator SanA